MTRGRRGDARRGVAAVAAGLVAATAVPAWGHGLPQRYELPIPLWLYLGGAAGAVAASFVMLALFGRRAAGSGAYPRVDLRRWLLGRALTHPTLLGLARLASVALFGLIVAAGLAGNESPFKNLAPVMVWVIFWVGLSITSALLGDLWAVVNPWDGVFAWVERLGRPLRPGGRLSRDVAWPRWLGVWPAVLLFLGFAWMELVWPDRDRPRSLVTAILLYSGLTWTGMLVFGREAWLRGGEVFSVVFGLLARFAPTEIRVPHRAACGSCASPSCAAPGSDCVGCHGCYGRADAPDRQWNLRPPGVGLLSGRPVHPSVLALVFLMLATVTFDGFLETPVWAAIRHAVLPEHPILPLGVTASEASPMLLPLVLTLALVAAPLIFVGVYAVFTRLMVVAMGAPAPPDGAPLGPGAVGRLFVLTLLPIAIAYHVAHYLSFFLLAGQLVIPLASDPFGLGWDLFGTTLYRMDIGIMSARAIWYTAVTAIAAGHVIAVYLAHLTAVRAFGDERLVLRSQVPLVVLMVGYTMISLWILAQPVVKSAS